MTSKKAIELANTKWWKNKISDEIVRFQLFEPRLCIPFDKFHKSIETVLKRPVWTHEFANMQCLQAEFLGERNPPTMEEILEMIPEVKHI